MPGAKRASLSQLVRPPLPALASAHAANSLDAMPRSSASSVGEDVWAKAIHAVKVQKMSLRNAAQLYGVHHMSLHRRVRGRYATSIAPSFDIRSFLSESDEAEVLGVLREQFLHEKRITSDDIRFVVRAIASHGGKLAVPPEFPPSRWIVEFKRAHGFAKLNSYAYPPVRASASMVSRSGSDDVDMDDSESASSGNGSITYSRPPPPRYVVPSYRHDDDPDARHLHDQRSQQEQEQQQRRPWNDNDDADDDDEQQQQQSDNDREEFGSFTSHGSFENGGTTTGSSCSSFESSEQSSAPAADAGVSSSAAQSQQTQQAQQQQQQSQPPQRTYKLSHTVPPETWEKAIAAVEQQGMSLRAAARAYGVHFAALHRRVKKRAQGDAAAPMDGYFHPDDEAGIIRVVVARAELGVLMTFDELMDLVQRAALRNLPDISVDAARKLMARFQARNEHSTRHIIVDWPLPRIGAMSLNSSSGSGSSHGKALPASAASSTVRVVRTSSRPPVIVTNSSDTAGTRPAATPSSTFGSSMPPARMLASSLGVSGSSSSSINTSAPPLGSAAPPLRSELPSSHSLFLRAAPSASASSASVKRSNSSSEDKSTPIMFV